MKIRASLSLIFYVLFIFMLVLGLYLWKTYSLYRIIILYSSFCIILLWLTNTKRNKTSNNGASVSRRGFKYLAFPLIILPIILAIIVSRSVYTRPAVALPLMGIILILTIILLIEHSSVKVTDRPFFLRQSFLLPVMIFIFLFPLYGLYDPEIHNDLSMILFSWVSRCSRNS